jgi:hypothetical protein
MTNKSGKRLPWWRRPIDEKKFGIFGTRAGAMLLIGFIVVLIQNPWLIVVLVALAATGAIFALLIRRSNSR